MIFWFNSFEADSSELAAATLAKFVACGNSASTFFCLTRYLRMSAFAWSSAGATIASVGSICCARRKAISIC